MNPEKYPHQIDCVWLACDRDGFLAAFVSRGVAPIPTIALESRSPEVEDIEGLIHALPGTSAALLLVSMSQPDSFRELAERGLFVYDWQDIHRTRQAAVGAYELVAMPVTPLPMEALPGLLRESAMALCFETLTFAARTKLDAREQLACVAGD